MCISVCRCVKAFIRIGVLGPCWQYVSCTVYGPTCVLAHRFTLSWHHAIRSVHPFVWLNFFSPETLSPFCFTLISSSQYLYVSSKPCAWINKETKLQQPQSLIRKIFAKDIKYFQDQQEQENPNDGTNGSEPVMTIVTYCLRKYVTTSFNNRNMLQVHVRTYTPAICL